MVNFFKLAIANNLVAGLTAITFTTAIIVTPPCHAVGANLDLKGINFGIKVGKIFEKIKKSIDKGETNKTSDFCQRWSNLRNAKRAANGDLSFFSGDILWLNKDSQKQHLQNSIRQRLGSLTPLR